TRRSTAATLRWCAAGLRGPPRRSDQAAACQQETGRRAVACSATHQPSSLNRSHNEAPSGSERILRSRNPSDQRERIFTPPRTVDYRLLLARGVLNTTRCSARPYDDMTLYASR